MLASAMDEQELQRRLTELFLRLGYEAEARSLAKGNGTNVSLAKDGVRIDVRAEPGERPTRRRRRP
jgi:hypothetical protein